MNIKFDVALSLIGRAFVILLSIFSTYILSRGFSKEIVGRYFIIEATALCFSSVFLFGFETVVTRKLSISDKDEYSNIVGFAAFVSIASSFALGLILSVAAIFQVCTKIHLFDLKEVGLVYVLAVVNIFLELVLAVAQGAKHFRLYIIICISNSCLFLFLLWMMAAYHLEKIDYLVCSRGASLVCIIICTCLLFARRYKPIFSGVMCMLSAEKGYALNIWMNNVLTIVFLRMDTALVGNILGLEKVAEYEMAKRIPNALRALFQSVRTVMFTHLSGLFAEQEYLNIRSITKTNFLWLVVAGIFASLFFGLMSNKITILLFSLAYEQIASIIVILVVALFLGFASNILGTTVLCSGDSRSPMLINLFTMTGNFLFIFTIGQKLGLTGIALVSIGSSIVSLFLNFIVYNKCMKQFTAR